MFLSFLLENKTTVIIAILLSVMLGEGTYIFMLKAHKQTLVAEKATLTVMLTESQANIGQLQHNIQAQNTAINVLKHDGDVRVAKSAVEVKKAQDLAETYKQRANDLLNRQASATVPKCDAANLLINEEINNVRK